MKAIIICENHPEYQVPLIDTLAFIGAENWCPYCGVASGMLGAGEPVPCTPELDARYKAFLKLSKDFLDAAGVRVCSRTIWKGKYTEPQDLPQEEKDRLNKIYDDWKYGAKVEQVAV